MLPPPLVNVVCTANVCRSPMAAELLRHALRAEPAPLNQVRVVSSGVAAFPGQPATGHSATVLRKVGLDLSSHRSSVVTPEFERDAIVHLCMTESHRHILQEEFPGLRGEVRLYREFIPGVPDPVIPDPYGGPLHEYEACRDSMVEAVPHIIAWLRQKLGVTPTP